MQFLVDAPKFWCSMCMWVIVLVVVIYNAAAAAVTIFFAVGVGKTTVGYLIFAQEEDVVFVIG